MDRRLCRPLSTALERPADGRGGGPALLRGAHPLEVVRAVVAAGGIGVVVSRDAHGPLHEPAGRCPHQIVKIYFWLRPRQFKIAAPWGSGLRAFPPEWDLYHPCGSRARPFCAEPLEPSRAEQVPPRQPNVIEGSIEVSQVRHVTVWAAGPTMAGLRAAPSGRAVGPTMVRAAACSHRGIEDVGDPVVDSGVCPRHEAYALVRIVCCCRWIRRLHCCGWGTGWVGGPDSADWMADSHVVGSLARRAPVGQNGSL